MTPAPLPPALSVTPPLDVIAPLRVERTPDLYVLHGRDGRRQYCRTLCVERLPHTVWPAWLAAQLRTGGDNTISQTERP
jgi:hypothetical protein